MVNAVQIAETPGTTRRFDLLVTVDESGIHDSSTPTVVSASFSPRFQAEVILQVLIENEITPFVQKGTDLSATQIRTVLNDLSIPVTAMGTWENVSASTRGVVTVEAIKRVVQQASTPDERSDCLVILDGAPSNYGGKRSILKSKTEILDSYFENQNNVSVSIATLPKADRRYPEVTITDLACRSFVNRVEQTGSIPPVDAVVRFDPSRSVPSVEYSDENVYSLASTGVSDDTTVRSSVVAWCRGTAPSVDAVGTADAQSYEQIVQASIDKRAVRQYLLQQGQPGSQQA